MKFPNLKYWFLVYCIFIPIFHSNLNSQTVGKTIVKGSVVEAKTGTPLPFVSVILKNTTVGTITDKNGRYFIETTVKASAIAFSFIGYEKESRAITMGQTQTINIKLNPASYSLNEVIVKPKKVSYSNRNNPAVDLIQSVINKKSENRMEDCDYLEYDKYEKSQFSLSKISEKNRQGFALKNYQFLFDNIDTIKQRGKEVLPFYIKETLSKCYYRKSPTDTKEIIKGEKTVDFDEYVDTKGLSSYVNYLYQNINIYDNDIFFLTNKFLSPIAKSAPTFYKYYIIDTLQVSEVKCIRMFFEARNKADFLFQGFLFITQDSTYAVRKIDMNLNSGINIDWVKNVKIVQDFVRTPKKTWIISKDDIAISFEVTKNMTGLYGERSVSYSNYIVNKAINDSIFAGQKIDRRIDPSISKTDYWETNRPVALSKSEKGIYTNIDSLKKIPAFKRSMKIIMLFTTSYFTFNKFEIGPWGSFYSFNNLEGNRIKIGGATTSSFSKKLILEGYLAYGTRDYKYKYFGAATYSLTPRTIYQFPVKYLKLSYQDDVSIPGQDLQFDHPDSYALSFKRGITDKFLYYKVASIEYLNEFNNHFSFGLGYKISTQKVAGNLIYKTDYLDTLNNISGIKNSEVNLTFRYAPNEEFYQGKHSRSPLPSKYPVFQLRLAMGLKSIYNDYNYSRVQFSFTKTFYPSIIGYTYVTLEGGKIFGKVPFPLLFIHNANQSFIYQDNSYNMMNFLEFVSDQYISLNIDHCFNGFIFNKIPLLKKLKLREVVTCKILYGGISNLNDPSKQSDLFRFPTDKNGKLLTYSLEKKPYVEAGLGISNVFKILRMDIITRISYTTHENAPTIWPFLQFRLDI
jgi:hypothetical protein